MGERGRRALMSPILRLDQDFDGHWDAEGLRKLAAALKGVAETLEA